MTKERKEKLTITSTIEENERYLRKVAEVVFRNEEQEVTIRTKKRERRGDTEEDTWSTQRKTTKTRKETVIIKPDALS